MDNYRELTATEKTALEAREFPAPTEQEISALAVQGVGFSDATGLFALAGVEDLTFQEAQAVAADRFVLGVSGQKCSPAVRVNLAPALSDAAPLCLARAFEGAGALEVANLGGGMVKASDLEGAFSGCGNLRAVNGAIDLSEVKSVAGAFGGCGKLADVKLHRLGCDIDLSACSALSLESLRYLLFYAGNTEGITIKLPAAVYDRAMADTGVCVPGTESTDWEGYTPNLLLNTNRIISTGGYGMVSYILALKPLRKADYTITIWGAVGQGRQFFTTNSGDAVAFVWLNKLSDGVYGNSNKWENVSPKGLIAEDRFIRVYQYPSASSEFSTINQIKFEPGINPNPQWTACSDDIADPEIRALTQWREIPYIAAARNISLTK